MPRLTKKQRLDALVDTFTDFYPVWVRWLTANMPGPEVSYVRLRLLHALESRPDRSLTMSGLATALDITQRRVTALVDAMQEEGLVTRRPHPTDGRSTVVTTTAKGARQQQQSWDQRQIDIGRVFDDLSPAHQAQLVEIIPLLNDALRQRVRSDRP